MALAALLIIFTALAGAGAAPGELSLFQQSTEGTDAALLRNSTARELINIETLNVVDSNFCAFANTYGGINSDTTQCPYNTNVFGGGYLYFDRYNGPPTSRLSFRVCAGCVSGCLSSLVQVSVATCYQSSSFPRLFFEFFAVSTLGQIWTYQGLSDFELRKMRHASHHASLAIS